jgi:hypothetical protein
MSDQSHWNPATESYKAERPNMFGHSHWNPARRSDMSGLIGVFGGKIDF